MTVEELQIIVDASVENAVKEFKKLLPSIKQELSKIQKEFDNSNIKDITAKVDMNALKSQMREAKKTIKDTFDPNDTSGIKFTGVKREISGVSKEIKKMTGSRFDLGNMIEIQNYKAKLNDMTNKTEQTTGKMQKYNSQDIENFVNNYQTGDMKKNNYYAKNGTTPNVDVSPDKQSLSLWDTLKNKIKQIKPAIEQAKSSSKGLNSIKLFLSKTVNECQKLSKSFFRLINPLNYIKKIVGNIFNKIRGSGVAVKQGIGHVLKYATALFSLRSIYSLLSNSANSWLSSQNEGAQQLSANIEYMKYAMGSVFAPVIEYVINLVYKLMKAIQSLAYAFSGINIFAKATASSMKNTAGSAKQASKSLSGIHSEINNVSENNGGGSGETSPNMDLSGIDNEMSPLSQKLYEFFKPLKDSWDAYGRGLIEQVKITANQIGSLITTVWESFENIIANGTVYSVLENILAIIGNIAEAFSNAWNYNGNGDAIVQNLANAFDKLLMAINNVVKSDGFQDFLQWCSDKFSDISEKIANIDWQPLMDALSTIGENIGKIAVDILNGLVDIFKWLAENPIVGEILLGIAIAIGIVGTALGILSTIMAILNPILATTEITLLPLIGIILGIIAVISAIIAIIVICINHWEEIKIVVMNVVNAVVGFIQELWNKVSFVFEAIWDVISTVLGFIWNIFATVFEAIWNIVSPIINAIWTIISTVFQTIWTILSTILTSIWNIFSQVFNWIWQLISKVFEAIWNIISPIITKIWETIKFVLGKIQEIWSSIWQTISNVVSNVWNGIWNGIKKVINFILGGIENFVNGTIRGINKLLSGISSVANAIGSLIGLDPINLQISTISLPRLAKGGVLTEATAVVAGEYSDAKSNPEIITPQNIMEETFDRVLSRYEGNNERPLHLTIQYLGKEIFDDTIDYINERTRQMGQCVINVT